MKLSNFRLNLHFLQIRKRIVSLKKELLLSMLGKTKERRHITWTVKDY